MLTSKPTNQMIQEWKDIYNEYHHTLTPNRKTGKEVDTYFKNKYSYQIFNDSSFKEMVLLNILENEFYRSKLQEDTLPNIQCYKCGNILVAIDLNSGEFHIESDDIEEVEKIHDDLFLYRGLDKDDLKNYFLVAEYIKLKK